MLLAGCNRPLPATAPRRSFCRAPKLLLEAKTASFHSNNPFLNFQQQQGLLK